MLQCFSFTNIRTAFFGITTVSCLLSLQPCTDIEALFSTVIDTFVASDFLLISKVFLLCFSELMFVMQISILPIMIPALYSIVLQSS